MFEAVINKLFGCSHRRKTFPITPARRVGAGSDSGVTRTGTYVVCLDCGKEFDYDWKVMHIGKAVGHLASPVHHTETLTTVNR